MSDTDKSNGLRLVCHWQDQSRSRGIQMEDGGHSLWLTRLGTNILMMHLKRMLGGVDTRALGVTDKLLVLMGQE